MMKKISVLLLSLFISTAAFSQTWEGDVSSDWNDPLNWSGNTLPGNDDNVVINPSNYTNAPIMSANSAFEPGDITISNSGTFTITAGDITVRDDIFVDNATFTISGGTIDVDEITGNNSANVNLTGGTISMSNDLDANSGSTFTIATTVTQTSGGEDLNIGQNATFIIQAGANITGFDDVDFDQSSGTLTMTGGILDIGDDFKFEDGDDNTVNVSGGTLNVGDDFEIETDNNQITFTGTADVNVSGDFEFGVDGGGAGNDATNSNVNVNGNATLDVTGDINFYEGGSGSSSFLNVSGNGAVTTNNVDDLGSVNITEGGTVNDGGTILPVELLFFNGKLEQNFVVLSWHTASELNNDYFEILRSKNGVNFTPIGTVKGAGTTSELSQYTFNDQTASGTNYYQLRQVDYDGASESFNIIRVESALSDQLVVYPNPVPLSQNFTLKLDTQLAPETSVQVVTMDGKVVLSEKVSNGSNSATIDSSQLKKGNYLVILESNAQRIIRRISVN
ncbi:T9SS type A sorting domain-containing protein [Ekhidna sp.]